MTQQQVALEKGAEPYPGYRLLDFLGQGGWGQVWKAEKPNGAHVALKFLPCDSHLAAAQEVRALQSMRQLVHHPNIIEIYRIWCWEGHVVVAMPLAEGSLLDLLEVYYAEFGKGIIPQHLCFFLAQVASALDFLNARQHQSNGVRVAVRHCDVKPSNMLLQGQVVKLADFSLAATTTSPVCHHRRVGTLNYAAPELFQGWLTDKTDQYALAVSYCELRSGRLPFHDTPDHFDKTYQRPVPDLSMLSPAERPIILRGLTSVPQDRWPSCAEMLARLSRKVKDQEATW